ncbi:MinD/ParA family protein [Alicyclobacillaceae bacterium I2511]|nr:MinD/ParA family protein [Alicyclobacillaceae bacterium I2511]
MADQAEKLRALVNALPREGTDSDTSGTIGKTDSPAKSGGVIAVTSGKGGVGKSNLSLNLAIALQEIGKNPVVIDTDVGFADVEVLVGLQPHYTLLDVVAGVSIDQALTLTPNGLPFLAAGSGLLNIHDISETKLQRFLQEMDGLQKRFDWVVVDCGAGLGKNVGRILAAADEMLLVTTPEPTSIADAYALLKMLAVNQAFPITRVVVNRAKTFAEARVTAEKLQRASHRFLGVSLELLGFVLEDGAVGRSVKAQTPLLLAFPRSPAAGCIRQLAYNYLKITKKPDFKGGLRGFFQRLLTSKT